MRNYQLYHLGKGISQAVNEAEIPALLQADNGLLWIDILQPKEDDFSWLADTFHLHPLAIEDMQNQRQRGKVDRYENYYFFVQRAIDYHAESHSITSQQLNIIIGTRFIITVQNDNIAAMPEVHKRWQQTRLADENSSHLFYLISDMVVDSYFPIIDQIGELIDDMDEAVLLNPSPESLGNIFTLRRALLEIRKILGPMRDAYNELIREEESEPLFLVGQTRLYINDVYDHILRLTDFVDTYREMLSGTLEAYQSSQSNRLNANMQRLTVGATVLATATLITGFFGMNLSGLGINSHWPYASLVVCLILLIITAIEIWLFRRIKWL